MAKRVNLGPGTVTVKVGTGTAQDFAGECKSGAITHSYDEIGEARTYLDGHTHGASSRRTDGFKAELDNDLTAAGLYQFLQTHDLAEAELEFTPNSASGAKWVGKVTLTLPDELGADEFGAPLASSVEWAAVGVFTFTAEATTP